MAKRALDPPTKAEIKKIIEKTMIGGSQRSIASYFGISEKTFHDRKKKYPDIADALNRGYSEGELTLAQLNWNIANDKDHPKQLVAIHFCLRNRFKWSEMLNVTVQDIKDLPGKVTSTIMKNPDDDQ